MTLKNLSTLCQTIERRLADGLKRRALFTIAVGTVLFALVNAPGSEASPQAGTSRTATAKFEVASIKRHKPSGPRMMFRIMNSPNDGRFYATGPTVKMLLRMAYDVQDSQILEGPNWIDSERFDIQAKADSAVDAELRKLSPDQAKLVKEHMLQALLADRFGLKLHHETKELPVYALVVAKNGPKLEKAKDQTSGPADKGRPGGPGLNRGVQMRVGGGEWHLNFQDSPIPFFVTILSQSLGRTFVDKTGLEGRYNFRLHWAGGGMMMGGPGPGMMAGPGAVGSAGTGGNAPLSMPEPAKPDISEPSIFTALHEQLGLKLKPEKGHVQVLVIDHIHQPTAN